MTIADFGLHRIGLLALRKPQAMFAVALFALILSIIGLSRLTIDTSLTRLFHGGSVEYAKYERLLRAVPASEYDVLIFLHGKRLLDPDNLEAMREFHLEARVTPGVRAVASVFSARKPATAEGEPDTILPDDGLSEVDLTAIETQLLQHPLIHNRLLSKKDNTGQAALIVVSLDPSEEQTALRDNALVEINDLGEEFLTPSGVTWQLGGVPVARDEMLKGIQHDLVFLNGGGFLLAVIVCLLVFRDLRFVVVAAACPLIAALLAGGVIGLAGVKLNPLMNTVPLLVMSVTFTDAMHMLFAIRGQRQKEGVDLHTSIAVAVREIGPACILASLTTAAALFSLWFTDTALISAFGLWAAVGSTVGVLSLLVFLPFLSVLLLAKQPTSVSQHAGFLVDLTTGFCKIIADFVVRNSRALVVFGLALAVVLTALYTNLKPKYRLADQLPQSGSFRNTNSAVDRHLGGSNPVSILIQWREDQTSVDERLALAIRSSREILMQDKRLLGTLSILELVRGTTTDGLLSDQQVFDQLRSIPVHLYDRFYNEASRSTIVSALARDAGSEEISALAEDIDTKLATLQKNYPEFQFTVTSMPVMLSRDAPKIMQEINKALISAFVIVIVVIGCAFRSLGIALLSIVPNLLPVFAAAAITQVFVGGLDYASIVGLTVAFGLAVDDTTHFFNRLASTSGQNQFTHTNVRDAIVVVGPVLIFTTIILMCALASTVFGQMPPTQIFGQTCLATLMAALIADLIILPALIMQFRSRVGRL